MQEWTSSLRARSAAIPANSRPPWMFLRSTSVWWRPRAPQAAQAGRPVFVAGNVGPSGHFARPLGDMEPEELIKAFSEQIRGLVAGRGGPHLHRDPVRPGRSQGRRDGCASGLRPARHGLHDFRAGRQPDGLFAHHLCRDHAEHGRGGPGHQLQSGAGSDAARGGRAAVRLFLPRRRGTQCRSAGAARLGDRLPSGAGGLCPENGGLRRPRGTGYWAAAAAPRPSIWLPCVRPWKA